MRTRTSASTRATTGALVGALVILGIATAPVAGAVSDVTTARHSGADRYATAAAVAHESDFSDATTAILATGETFPDALAAAGLAGARASAPIVLTESERFTPAAQDALADLASLTDVFIVGGTGAISDEVEAAVTADGYDVTRLAGDDRYETAAAIAREIGAANVGTIDGRKTALLATGAGFADALAGGPLAYASSMPILLVSPDAVPTATEDALDALGITQAIVLGGTTAVSTAVATSLADITGNPVVRVAGANRFGTAAAVAELGVTELAWAPDEVLLASGLNFPDALAGGALGGERHAPILLLASVPQETSAFLDLHSDTIATVACLGGTAACAASDLTAAETAAENANDDGSSDGGGATEDLTGPELQRVQKVDTDVDELAIVYRFTFDEDVEDEPDGADFRLYSADTRHPASGDTFNGGADIEVDGESVDVVFNLADYSVADATLGAVAQGAVTDDDGNENPAQSLGVSGSIDSVGDGLVSVEIADEDEGIARFTFDTAQVPGLTETLEYQLIDRDGTVYVANELTTQGTSDTFPDDEEPSTSVVVDFDEDLSDATIRRGIAISNPTLPIDAEDERIQAAAVASGGATDGPDLVEIELASDNDDLEDDQALFIFDEDVEEVGASPASFDLVYSHCDPTAAESINDLVATHGLEDEQPGQGYDDEIEQAATCAIPGTAVVLDEDVSTEGVIVTFATEEIDNQFLIAGQVDDDAAVEDGDGDTNLNDEVQYAAADDLYDNGFTTGPQLVSVDATTELSSGDFSHYEITFTFDKDLDDDVPLGDGFQFFVDDGNDAEADTIDVDDCDVDDDTTVVCEISDDDSEIVEATVVSVDAGTVQTNDAYDIDDDEVGEQVPNPEVSVSFDSPEEP